MSAHTIHLLPEFCYWLLLWALHFGLYELCVTVLSRPAPMNLNINLISPASAWLSQVLSSPHFIMECQLWKVVLFHLGWGMGGFSCISSTIFLTFRLLVMSEYLWLSNQVKHQSWRAKFMLSELKNYRNKMATTTHYWHRGLHWSNVTTMHWIVLQ